MSSPGKVQREVRKSLGLRQVAVAKQAKIDRSRLSLIENEWVEARPDEVARISEAISKLAEKHYQNGSE